MAQSRQKVFPSQYILQQCPRLINGIQNVVNTLSEHDGVCVNLHTSERLSKPQFTTKRIYKNVTHDKLMEILDETRNAKIQLIFTSQNPDFIASTLLEEVNAALKNLMIIKKEQVRKHKMHALKLKERELVF